MGGLLAYEIDRLLLDGPHPAALMIAATPPPGRQRAGAPPHEFADLPLARHRIGAPLLLLMAGDDPVGHPDDAARWLRLAGDRVTTRTLPGTGHFLPGEHLEETLEIVRAFLRATVVERGGASRAEAPVDDERRPGDVGGIG